MTAADDPFDSLEVVRADGPVARDRMRRLAELLVPLMLDEVDAHPTTAANRTPQPPSPEEDGDGATRPIE
jgi:hypothetical protein